LSIARTTDHAIIKEGEGALFPFFCFAASRALRRESQRASICRFAGMTRLSLRVIVGESAGSRVVAAVVGRGLVGDVSGPRPVTAVTDSLTITSPTKIVPSS